VLLSSDNCCCCFHTQCFCEWAISRFLCRALLSRFPAYSTFLRVTSDSSSYVVFLWAFQVYFILFYFLTFSPYRPHLLTLSERVSAVGFLRCFHFRFRFRFRQPPPREIFFKRPAAEAALACIVGYFGHPLVRLTPRWCWVLRIPPPCTGHVPELWFCFFRPSCLGLYV